MPQADPLHCIHFPNVSDIGDVIPDIGQLVVPFTQIFYVPQALLAELGHYFPPTIFIPDWIATFSIPAPITHVFGDLIIPSVEAALAAASSLQAQMVMVFKEMVRGLTTFISAIPFPTMPPFGMDFSDLLTFDISGFLAKMKLPEFDFSAILNLPELWVDLGIPSLKLIMALQTAVTGYFQSMIQHVINLLHPFLDLLNAMSLGSFSIPALPQMPSLADIYKKMISLVPEITLPALPSMADLEAAMKRIITEKLADIASLFDGIMSMLPGFDFSLNLPNPLLPDIHMPSFDFTYKMNSMFTKMTSIIQQKLVDFIDSLPLISDIIKWPKISDWMGMLPAMPSLCNTKPFSVPDSFSSGVFHNIIPPIPPF